MKTTGTSVADWTPGLLAPTPSDGIFQPGDDLSLTDLVVRTGDSSTFEVQYRIEQPLGAPTNWTSGPTQLVVTVNNGAHIADDWVQSCGSGASVVSVTPTVLTCNTGSVSSSTNRVIPNIEVVAPIAMGNGAIFTVGATLTGTGSAATDTSAQVTTSAAPRVELVKQAWKVIPAKGPLPGGPQDGILQQWVVGVRAFGEPFGVTQLVEPIVLDDLALSTPSGSVFLQSCGSNTVSNWPEQVPSATNPLVGHASRLRRPSTPVSCTQGGGPSTGITINLTGLDWNRASGPPTLAAFGGALTGDRRNLLTYVTLDTWISKADIEATDPTPDSGSVVVCNTVETSGPGQAGSGSGPILPWLPNGAVSTWHPTDVQGQPNLGGVAEPVANNGACAAAKLTPTLPSVNGGFFKAAVSPTLPGAGVQPGAITKSRLAFFNSGNQPYPGAILCDKWDNSRFAPPSATFLASTGSYSGPFTFEYGTGDWGAPPAVGTDGQKWQRQAIAKCDNAATTWSTMPPTAATNMVRIKVDNPIPPGQLVDFTATWLTNTGLPAGDQLRNYSAGFLAHTNAWTVSNCPPTVPATLPASCRDLAIGEPAGVNSHWWSIIAGTAEVVKDVVGATNYSGGDTVTWRIRVGGRATTQAGPSATGITHAVILRDTLPPGFTYVTGSAGTVVGDPVITTSGGVTVLEWNLGNLSWMTAGLYNVDFHFDTTVSPFTNPGPNTNLAKVSTPDDPTPYGTVAADLRLDDALVNIVAAGGAAIDKSVTPTQPDPGDTVTYTLRYGNPSSSPITSMDAVDLLPFPGDPRGSHFTAGSFPLTGVTPSGNGEVVWVSGQPPSTLDLLDNVADGFVDPANAGPVGSTTWPCTLAQVTAASCGLSLAQVTAVRFVGTGTMASPFLPAGQGPFAITMTFQVGMGVSLGDLFANSWAARFEGLIFTVHFRAQDVTITRVPPPLTTTTSSPTTVPGVGPTTAGPGHGHLAATGVGIDGLVSEALLALALGMVVMVAVRKRRLERRVAFCDWVEHAELDEILGFLHTASESPVRGSRRDRWRRLG